MFDESFGQFCNALTSLISISLQAILNTHPYHVDSLLQLSEICKMGEDYQMAAELIGQFYRSNTVKECIFIVSC